MNNQSFLLSIQDASGRATLLDGYIEQEGKYIDIYMGQTENGTRQDTYMHFVMGDDDQLLLADLMYRKTCDIRGIMEERTGTKRMLMGAMKYLFKMYPRLNEVTLSDIAQKYNTRVYLTPKRLLLRKKGWYEDYFWCGSNSKNTTTHSSSTEHYTRTERDD
jgi:hypothetical protein